MGDPLSSLILCLVHCTVQSSTESGRAAQGGISPRLTEAAKNCFN